MTDAKYIGMDVHTATISAAVRDSSGNLVMEATLETKAETILEFVHGLRGSLHVSFEEGTCAVWLHDLLKPHVAAVLVCDSRKNASMKAGNKNDRADARQLAEMPFCGDDVEGARCVHGKARECRCPGALRQVSLSGASCGLLKSLRN